MASPTCTRREAPGGALEPRSTTMPSAARDERIAVPSELDPERVRSFLKAVDDRIRQLSRAWPD